VSTAVLLLPGGKYAPQETLSLALQNSSDARNLNDVDPNPDNHGILSLVYRMD
jgi:hypothetical protein